MNLLVLLMCLWSAAAEAARSPDVAAGFALAVGCRPMDGIPTVALDLLPVEIEVELADRRALAIQVDWAQLLFDSLLASRRRIGLSAWHDWRTPLVRSLAFDVAMGIDTAIGLDIVERQGRVARLPSAAFGPSTRLGLSVAGPGGHFRQGLHLRGTFGPDLGAMDDVWFTRGMVEATFTWGPS